ncbi:hypothetical protein F8O01_06155 [Pseudoclavibacter chungangensis]|uniref:Uncharacterized protein n=1 Tax=Pseudoclavibacter chungangensis TaxID=587635 RepID=A0A7J5BYS0_9MICO|nr:hypothetical protein [Pseudoclavibacter chungangensis]KAB1659505.1 hypothetical protein F8O01_06155 [Pseudoclavibacter chungangensis]NYJ67635.1 hypothetical protein [Pseudoclavibacter chungangensis]
MRSLARAVVVALSAALVLTGCQAQLVTIVDAPGWGNAQSEASVAPGGPIMADVLEADVPSLCGIAKGKLAGGTLVASSTSLPIDSAGGPVASEAVVARDPGTGKPHVALATSPDATLGAAAIVDCVVEDAVQRDRVVLWDGALNPLGAINIAGLRGPGAVYATSIELDGDAALVTFVAADQSGQPKAGATAYRVSLAVVDGIVTVGEITEAA